MSRYCVIVDAGPTDAVWGRFVARVEIGTIESYYPGSTSINVRRPSAPWARRVAARKARRLDAREARDASRAARARRATGYDR